MAWAYLVNKQAPTLRSRALQLLARREYSRLELRRRLLAHAEPGDNVEVLLDDLAARGWLSEARLAENTARVKSRRFGPLKVVQLLRAKGLADEIIETGMRAAGVEGAAGIEAIWAGRYHAAPDDEREKARQVRFLQGRGFPLDEIFRFLRTLERMT